MNHERHKNHEKRENPDHADFHAMRATSRAVPKLRFPEFRDRGEWEEKTLQAVCENISSGRDKLFTAGDFDLYGSTGIIGKTVNATYEGRYILVARVGANAGHLTITDGKFGVTDNTLVILLRPSESLDFIFFSLIQFGLNRLIFGSGQPLITGTQLKELPIYCPPSLPEQQRIADCLTSLDAVITAEAQKLDTLKAHKKGLMQQLFPAEGETVPKLRFLKFQNDPGWDEVALGTIAEIKLGKMLDKQKHTAGNLLPYLNNQSVRWNEVNTTNLPRMYFADDEVVRFGLKAGDVVVCEGGEPGRAAVWDGRIPELKFQKAIHRVRFNVPFEAKFLVLHLENIAGTTQFEMFFTGMGIKHLTLETFTQLKVPFPSHAEQKHIADCLTSLDEVIAAQAEKIEALKAQKKGLMQGLFPQQGSSE